MRDRFVLRLIAAMTRMRPDLLLLSALFAASAHSSPATTWTHYAGYGVGHAGIVTLDLDGTAPQEAVVSGAAAGAHGLQFLTVLEHSPAGFRTRWMRLLADHEALLGKIVVHPEIGDPRVLATVRRWQGENMLATFSGPDLVRGVDVPVGTFVLHAIADVDGDGLLDAVGRSLSWGSHLGPVQIRNPGTGAVLWTDPGRVALDVVAAQLDADPALELVYASDDFSDTPGVIVDGASHGVEWTWDAGFAGIPVAGNFLAYTARSEFAVVAEWAPTRVFSTWPSYAPRAPFQSMPAREVVVVDFNADGIDELLIGNAPSGGVAAYRPANWSLVFDYWDVQSSARSLAAGQLDDDPALEVVFADSPSSETNRLTIFDAASLGREFDLRNERGPHSNVAIGDLDGDGRDELAYATLDSGAIYHGGTLVVLDAGTGVELRRLQGAVGSRYEEPTMQIMLANLDADAALEIVASGGGHFGGEVRTYDGATLAPQWAAAPSGGSVRAMAAYPLNADGVQDFVIVQDGRLRGIDGATGTVLWSTATFGDDFPVHVAVGQVDGDAAPEVVLALGTAIHVVDTTTRLTQFRYTAASPLVGLSLEDEDAACRIVHYLADRLDRHTCTGALDTSRQYAMSATTLARPLHDSLGPLLLSDGDSLSLDVDGQLAAPPTTGLGPDLGWSNKIAWRAHSDGLTAFAGSRFAVHRVEVIGPRIFADGFDD